MAEQSALAGRVRASQLAAQTALRFLMQPRDLSHPDACDFLAGNPQELALPEYVAALQAAAVPSSPSHYSYGPPLAEAVLAARDALSARLGIELDTADVFLTRGAASGLALVLRTIVDPGDEVVFMSPPWFFYEAIVLAEAATPVRLPLLRPAFDVDLDGLARSITPRTRAVIVNTPHNPSGRILPEKQLSDLGALLEAASSRAGRRIYLISDEAYARILFDGRSMITPGRFYPATFMLHTYSKSLLAPSQRAGYLAIPPSMPGGTELRMALLLGSIGAGAVPDTIMQHAMPQLERLIIDIPALQRRRDRMVSELRAMGYEIAVPDATFYLIPRSPIADAIEFCDWLAQHRVYALPGEAFELLGHFRLSLTATDEMIERALSVFKAAMETFAARSTAERIAGSQA